MCLRVPVLLWPLQFLVRVFTPLSLILKWWKLCYKGEKSVMPTWLISVDILVALRDREQNRSFQLTLWLSSAVEVESQCWLKAPVFIFYLSKLQGYLQTWVRNVSHSSPLCNLFFINFSRGGSEVIKRNWPSISGNEAHHSQDTRVLNSDSSRKNTRRNEIHSSQNRLLAATSTGVQWEGI